MMAGIMAGMDSTSESPLDVWRRKLDFLQKELAVAVNAAQRFELEEQIAKACREIAALGGEEVPPNVEPSPNPTVPHDPHPGELPPGTPLDNERFVIIERIGAGGEGEVDKARDTWLGEPVALKFPFPRGEDYPKRLFAEVALARRIDHPNVCRVHDVGLAAGRPFVAMAFYGNDLATVLGEAGGRMVPEAALVRGLELAEGLAAIHERGILHRDLKPENVLLDGLHRVRISDFGLARHAMDLEHVAGTPLYMAPELFRGDAKAASHQSDLYALGLILFRLFTGRLPFATPERGHTFPEWAKLHRGYPRRPPSELIRETIPADVDDIIVRCLAAEARERPASAQDVASVLRRCAPDEPPPEAYPQGATETRTPTWPQAPKTTDGGLLTTWLAAVVDDNKTLVPFFEHGSNALLEHVYVELQIAAQDADTLAGRPLSLQEVLELKESDHPWVKHRWLLRGDPGSGKTTLLRHFAARMARDGGEPWVPLFDSLPRWMRGTGDLFSRADSRLERGGRTVSAPSSLLRELADEGRLLLLLDGLDEVPREKREDAFRSLRDLNRDWPRTPIVVTSRPIGVERPHPDFVELDLRPFDRARCRSFLARWFGRADGTSDEERAAELVSILHADRRLEELGGNPLYLTLMALLHESGKRPERNRARLYDQVFDMLYEGRHKTQPATFPNRNAAHNALAYLGYGMTLDNLDAEALKNLDGRLRQEEAEPLRQALASEERWRDTNHFLEDLAEHTGILGPHDGRHLDWRFWHRTFREALAAEELERQLRAARPSFVDVGLGKLGFEIGIWDCGLSPRPRGCGRRRSRRSCG